MEDQALIKKALKGNRVAFSTLLTRHYDYMYKIAFKLCCNQSDAQDITQNACIKLVHALESFRGDSSFTTWLYTLVTNTAKDYFKQQGKHRNPADTINPQEHKTDEKIIAQQLLEKIAQLPEPEKEILILVSFQNLSHAEVAKKFNCAESTISWRVHEARKILASSLEMTANGENHG